MHAYLCYISVMVYSMQFPPEICWYPRINYSISMSRRSSGAAVLQTDAHDFEAHFGSFVVFTTDKLIANDVYFIVARIEVTGGFTGGFVAQTNSSKLSAPCGLAFSDMHCACPYRHSDVSTARDVVISTARDVNRCVHQPTRYNIL